MREPIHIISLGAGVQSSTLALMAAAGEIGPMPVGAIFADTQDEPASVYTWLDWLEKQLPFPVWRVTAGSLSEMALKMRTSKKGLLYSRTDIPFFTRDFKLLPLRQIISRRRRFCTGIVCRWIRWIFRQISSVARASCNFRMSARGCVGLRAER